MKPVFKYFIVLFILSFSILTGYAEDKEIKIGVLAYRGKERCQQRWWETANYLSDNIKGCRFIIVPLGFDEVDDAVKNRKIDFVLVNSAMYVSLSKNYKVSLIATLENIFKDKPCNVFGGVIFTRADNEQINSIKDLKNKTFMAVKRTSFGGWQMALLVMKEHDFNPYKQLKSLDFGNTHDAVIMAVKDGSVEAGTVRTDMLEKMANEGKIKLSEFKVINRLEYPVHRFPFLCSTSLYPEWPFSKLDHVSPQLGSEVAIALMRQKMDSQAAKTAQIAGWSPPLNYYSVEKCLRELRVGPFVDYGKVTFKTLWAQYNKTIILAGLALIIIIASTFYVIFINKKLRKTARARLKELAERKRAEREMHQIFNTSGDGMRVMLNDRTVFKVNEQYLRMTGYSRNEIEKSSCKGFCNTLDECNADECILEKIQHCNRIENDFNLKHKDGSITPTIMTAVPYYNSEGKIIGTIQMFKDISDRLKAEKNSALEAEQRGKVEMAGSILHDIGNAIDCVSDVASKYIDSHRPWTELDAFEKIKQMLKSLDKSPEKGKNKKLETLIDKLQKLFNARKSGLQDDFTKISRSISHMNDILAIQRTYASPNIGLHSSINIIDLIEDATAMFYTSFQKRNINIQYHYADKLPALEVEKTQMLQVLINILRNACESFDEQKGNTNRFIFIRVTYNDTMVNIGIVDNAIGFARENQRLIFTKGYSTKEHSGMGLYRCRSIIESHHGKIEIHSDGKGKGTTVKISLPIPKQTRKQKS